MLNPLRNCANDLESTEHFPHHCPLGTLGHFNNSLLENTADVLSQTLLFGNTSLSPSDNSKILSAIIDFILSTKKFNEQLF